MTSLRQRAARMAHEEHLAAPGPLFVVRHEVATNAPAAPDGEAWRDRAIAVAMRIVGEERELTPTRLRMAMRHDPPPHPNHWGSVWAALPRYGLVRTRQEGRSGVLSRNAAREAVWRMA